MIRKRLPQMNLHVLANKNYNAKRNTHETTHR